VCCIELSGTLIFGVMAVSYHHLSIDSRALAHSRTTEERHVFSSPVSLCSIALASHIEICDCRTESIGQGTLTSIISESNELSVRATAVSFCSNLLPRRKKHQQPFLLEQLSHCTLYCIYSTKLLGLPKSSDRSIECKRAFALTG
jgi:hypothetical protein